VCGIAGVIGPGVTLPIVERMTSMLFHRGPDDGGYETLDGPRGMTRGVFGNRRLAILDLSAAGHQPMSYAAGRYLITYNGEIYNYRELRDELARDGLEFSTSGDTEVILAGWARWGARVLPRLRGMFAFAIWDRDEERAYLARDAFGIKPLYFAESDGAVLFASEVRALLASEQIDRSLCPTAVATYLATGSVAEPWTIIESVLALGAGSLVAIDCSRGAAVLGRAEQFASPFASREVLATDRKPTGERQMKEGRAGMARELRRVLRDSVSHHLISDVPVALFLSGGLDSSSVVALASEVSRTRLDSFTVTFDEPDHSEAVPARIVAEKFGTRHHEIALSGQSLLDALPEAFAAMDQPSLDGLNTYVVSGAVRAHDIKVVLSGLGGDELFGGYPSFRRASAIAPLWRLPGTLRRLSAAAAGFSSDPRLDRISTLLHSPHPGRAAYLASRTLFGRNQVRMLTGSADNVASEPTATSGRDDERLTLLQQVSLYETTGYMRNTLLRDSDVFSMAHSLELRVPFVDREVARVAMLLPDSVKLRRGASKPILFEAMEDLLPASLRTRPKQGFTLPFERWMRRELFREVDARLTSALIERVGLNAAAARQVWSEFQDGARGMSWSRPWALYTLVRWAEQHSVASKGGLNLPHVALKPIAATR
jgi:asparagine synthase (glutamine-hydrolysing)